MANTFNGIGTTYYGQCKFEQDGSYVTTKWFVVGFLPLVPMASARVRYEGTTGIPFLSRTSTFELVEELPIDGMQVLKTWVYTFLVIAVVSGVLTGNKPPALKIVIIAVAVFLPAMLRFVARRSISS